MKKREVTRKIISALLWIAYIAASALMIYYVPLG